MKIGLREKLAAALLLCMFLPEFATSVDWANFTINVKNSGSYYIWVRAKSPQYGTGELNAFIDKNLTCKIVYTDANQFVWKRSGQSFNLSLGSHVISFNSKTLGLAMDKFILTTDSQFTPTGQGPVSAQPLSVPKVVMVINLNGKNGTPIFGDATGDGNPDFIISGDQFVSVFDNSGNLLWQKQIAAKNSGYVGDGANPCRPIDIDNDGEPEVVGIIAINDTVYLASINGSTGTIETKLRLPILPNYYYYDALQIADLRGIGIPQDVIIKYAKDGYIPFNLSAYKFENGNFQLMWSFVSQSGEKRAGCHRPKVADIDQDGADEIVFGQWCLESDGTVRWEKSIHFFDNYNHTDGLRIGDIYASVPGLEVVYSSGTVVLDKDGNLLWRKDIPEGQSVAIADIRADIPGMELLFAYQEPYNDERLFTWDGQQLYLADVSPQFAASYETYPIQWIGDDGRESVRQEWGRDRSPSIYDEFNKLVVRLFPEYTYGEIGYRPCDVYGDYREELICFNENYIIVYQNIAENPRTSPSPWLDPAYRENQYNWVYY